MSKTSSRLPICVHCGTPRPADESLCPECGKPWIDTTIASEGQDTSHAGENKAGEDTGELLVVPPIPPAAAGEPLEADTNDESSENSEPPMGDGDAPVTEELDEIQIPPVVPPPEVAGKSDNFSFDDWTEEPDSRKSVLVWVIPILIAVVAAAVWGFIFLDARSSPTTTTIQASPTTTATTTPTPTTPPTTTPPATSPPTLTFPPPEAWPPTGDALDVSELPLKASGIGPLDLGTSIADVAGVLTASFGTAAAAGTDGVCKPDESYWLQWGDLRAIFDGQDPDATFVSFRNEPTEYSDVVLGIATLSGLEVGDTVQDLIATYPSYTVSFEVIDSVSHFRLVQGGELLLWGPVSSSDLDGIVEGVYSPSPCPTG